MGAWLSWNGEAIFNTIPWTTHSEGDLDKLWIEQRGHKFWVYENCDADDRRYTQSKDGKTVYAMTLGIPERAVTFEALNNDVAIDQVAMVESDQPVHWAQSGTGLTIDTKNLEFNTDLAAAWKVSLR